MATASSPKRSTTKEHRCSIIGRIFDNAETLNSHLLALQGRQFPTVTCSGACP